MKVWKRFSAFLSVSVLALSLTAQGLGTEAPPETPPAAQASPAAAVSPAVSVSSVPQESPAQEEAPTAQPEAPAEAVPTAQPEAPAEAVPAAQPEAPAEAAPTAQPGAGQPAEELMPGESGAEKPAAENEASGTSELPAGEEAGDGQTPAAFPDEEEAGILFAEQIDAKNPDRVIQIHVSWGEQTAVSFGDTLRFSAKLIGYEGLIYQLRWQFQDETDGIWRDMPGQSEETMRLVLDETNITWTIRLQVDISGLTT